ncbi:MAG: hypothetical protein KIT45_00465 [Fimbriimonadia bacterium]|nr:hypothetical protein [Fimbriimonadia bacterium]
MNDNALLDLQASVQDKTAFRSLNDYADLCQTFLDFVNETKLTRVVSPSHNHYIFYQYDDTYNYQITRPLNTHLLIEAVDDFSKSFTRFISFLADLKKHKAQLVDNKVSEDYLKSREIDKVVYTMQQAIGCIGDSFRIPNQSRKIIGQLFETLIKLIIQEVGLICEQRAVRVPIPGHADHELTYELDLVISHSHAVITKETILHPAEIIGSVKTTSKDRIDKIFLDKYLLSKLLGRPVPVVAIFLHDVQRAQRGNSIFSVQSTFNTNRFLGYTYALTRLDGVYYVDPRPEMTVHERLKEQIKDFQTFLTRDLWILPNQIE